MLLVKSEDHRSLSAEHRRLRIAARIYVLRRYRRRSPPQLETLVLTQVSNLTQLPLAGLGRYSCTVAGVFSEAPAFLPLTGRDASLDSA